MDDLIFGFEILGFGFLVVLFTLWLLAIILELFHRLFGETEKEKAPDQHVKTQPAAADVKPEGGRAEAPELVAASIGAILYTMEAGGYRHFAIKEVKALPAQRSNWALGGRTRLLGARQDFVDMRRRKNR
ncbi:MAG: OadG family protein [Bacillota bacterium]